MMRKIATAILVISIWGCIHRSYTPSLYPVSEFKPVPQGFVEGKAIVGPCDNLQEAMRKGIHEAVLNLAETNLPQEYHLKSIKTQYEEDGKTAKRFLIEFTLAERWVKVLKCELYQYVPLFFPKGKYGMQVMVIARQEDLELLKEKMHEYTPQELIELAIECRVRKVTEEDLEKLTPWQVRLLRNCFYAFYNRPFRIKRIQEFFEDHLPGYNPEAGHWNPNLAPMEQRNVIFILQYEKENWGFQLPRF